jgi:alkylation response protein AidB-like acyl-CoA dehydrogenase
VSTKTSTKDTAEAKRELSAELIGRARGLTALLAEKAPESDALRHISPEVMDALSQAELLSLGTPVMFGGQDVDLDTMFEVCYELARGCTSTAWCWQIWSLHSWFVGYMSDLDPQREIFAKGGDVLISSGYNPSGAVVEAADGGCMLSGRWGFSSGVDESAWVLLGAKVPGIDRLAQMPVLLCVPTAQVTIIDDWETLGLKGTGSKTVSIDEPIFVPEHLFLDLAGAEDGPAQATHGRDSYGLAPQAALGFVVAAPFIGAARAVLDDFVDEQRVKEDSFSKASKSDRASIQMRLGEAAAEIDSALYLSRTALREMLDIGASDRSLTEDERSMYLLHQVYAVELSRRAVTRLFEISGTAGMFTKSTMLRRFADIWTGSKHFAVRWDERIESYGRVRMGLLPNAIKTGGRVTTAA